MLKVFLYHFFPEISRLQAAKSGSNRGSSGSSTSLAFDGCRDPIKYVDVYRERPIRLTVRVLVPVREHPKVRGDLLKKSLFALTKPMNKYSSAQSARTMPYVARSPLNARPYFKLKRKEIFLKKKNVFCFRNPEGINEKTSLHSNKSGNPLNRRYRK